MLLRRTDIKMIVDILMGSETPEEEFELNELTISAVCEVMNQMMGAASTALSDFLGFSVNISTPQPFELDDVQKFKQEHLPQGVDTVVVVRFSLKIEEALESEFMNVMSVELARDLLKGLGLEEDDDSPVEPVPVPAPAPAPAAPAADSSRQLSQEEIERLMMANMAEPEPAPAAPAADSSRQLSQEEIERLMAGNAAPEPAPQPAPQPVPQMPQQPVPQQPMPQMPMQMPMPQMPMQMPPMSPEAAAAFAGGQMGYPPIYYCPYPYPPQPPEPVVKQPPDPKLINAKPMQMGEMDIEETLGKEQAQNLELIMEVPLQVTVEIGRTRRKVQDILAFSKGSLVVLDKLAGEQVDLFVNGKCIAKGDVVVVDDNFGVRITEIIQNEGIAGLKTVE